MILDFDFQQIMRLSSIKRWGIVEMSRSQSVAEHSYNVAMISMSIAEKLKKSNVKVDSEFVVTWALIHDLPEVTTGDIPTTLKAVDKFVFDRLEDELFPYFSAVKISEENKLEKTIIKIADYIDAIQFAQKFCIDSRKEGIIFEMIQKMDDVIFKNDMLLSEKLNKAVDRSWLNLRTV